MKEMKNGMNCVFCGVSTRGASRVISLKKSGGRHNNSIVLYKDNTVYEAKKNLEDILYKMSKTAPVASPFPGVFAIPDESIQQLTKTIKNAEASFATGLQEIEDNYDAIRDANWKAVEDAMKNLTKKEQKEVTKQFNRCYPTLAEIKRSRKMCVSILTSPLGAPSNISLLSERIEETAQELYKKAVFGALVPAYTALATYYTKLSNAQDIGTKSQNYFRDKVVNELFEGNTVRRDGFTDKVIAAIKYNIDNIFDDAMLCYNIVLNIYEEARMNGMEDELPDLAALEVQKLATVTKPSYLLDMASIEEDVPNRTLLDDMVGRIAVEEVV